MSKAKPTPSPPPSDAYVCYDISDHTYINIKKTPKYKSPQLLKNQFNKCFLKCRVKEITLLNYPIFFFKYPLPHTTR